MKPQTNVADMNSFIREGAAMEEKKETVQQIMIKVIDEMCDNYCKYPDMYVSKHPDTDEDLLEDLMYTEICSQCPLNRLC